ncbi:hypothetical protein FE257_004595 [Aspergillus nanangensis]|uniref:DUF7702 domain-containing protein n=1 Tax=Aspergillus nanangensis TaxID=2582783 RepID=A0AAD4GZH5_ASPNN|nr:hypothetical protein FE257_004595 [Aspergillus nanangensis]
MGTVTYRDGIAILQLIAFPVILVSALILWKRTGWRAGGRTWRYVVTLSLLRIIGGICTLLTITYHNTNIKIAEAVCELIGIAPLLLTYVGVLRQIDTEGRLPPRFLVALTVTCIVGLILGIAGVSTTDKNQKTFHANNIVKAAMGIFIAVFAILILGTGWLALQLLSNMSSAQKKFFLAIGFSAPLLLIRVVYSAIGDFSNDLHFSALAGNPTIYLCMSVLEEIIAISICVAFGLSAVPGKAERKPLAVNERRFDLETSQIPDLALKSERFPAKNTSSPRTARDDAARFTSSTTPRCHIEVYSVVVILCPIACKLTDRHSSDNLPRIELILAEEGPITTKDNGVGDLTPSWNVKLKVTYLRTIETSQRAISFLTPHSVRRHQRRLNVTSYINPAQLTYFRPQTATTSKFEIRHVSIILLILTFVSFLPQLHLLWTRKNASGISLSYVLLNLIAASEQFALNFGFFLLDGADDGIFVHSPITIGDWLNFAQTTLFSVLFLVYFTLCLWYPSESNLRHKRSILILYIVYLFIAVIPLFICAIIIQGNDVHGGWEEWHVVVAFVPHSLLLNYIATITAIVAVYCQARVILHSDSSESSSPSSEAFKLQVCSRYGSLSLATLAIQAIVFILTAVSWVFRVSFPPLPDGADWWNYHVLKVCYWAKTEF